MTDAGSESVDTSDSGAPEESAACGYLQSTLPEFFQFVPQGASEPLPIQFSGSGIVSGRSDVEVVVDVAGCCSFGLQRLNMPNLFDLGEEVDVAFGYADGLDPEWALAMRNTSTGRLEFFGFNGLFNRGRLQVLDLPIDIEVSDLCRDDGECYDRAVRLAVTLSFEGASVIVNPQERKTLAADDQLFQVLNYTSNRLGVPTGACSDSSPPGDYIFIQMLPASVAL
jgi:hypothetical protein